ncbi:AMP-binding protein [Nocardia sp. CDC160]|uniref:AMP-binding protein n=1 Tax=Nocardia sp. CDC160 TaxID=3112166 RepID=UPI002DBDCBC4|nr:AMP-binding protein [Nocardia sp. CDC160]MEC3919340.1 AMP-binding protein [Nocardia sp. CDC160]
MEWYERIAELSSRVAVEAHAVGTVVRAGMVPLDANLPAALRAMTAYGPIGGGITAAALRFGDRTGLIDELGALSFAELDRRSNALADAFRRRGIGPGTGVGILCRNHRGFLDATFACAKAGARALYLNTDFSGPQAVQVCAREGVQVLIYDQEFEAVVAEVDSPKGRFVAWIDVDTDDPTLEGLVAEGRTTTPPRPTKPGSVVMLTSGTTGTPKGAPRPQPKSFALPAMILGNVPLRGGHGVYIAPPMFHAWGFLGSVLGIGVGATLVTRRRFDPVDMLDAVAAHDCRAWWVIPVMLKRILDLGADEIRLHDIDRLRVIAASGAQLEGALARRTADAFGDVLYNLYGSTEVGYAAIANPADLRAAPGCAGRPPFGVTVRILDAEGRAQPTGERGRIFVRNTIQFTGYTGGGTKESIDGLMSSGDMGHFDASGRLFVDGRDDDMIVSGGENVFPQEVEELLAAHPYIADAAVVGVDDPEFGKALRAFIVPRPDGTLDAESIRAHVRANLARYKVPRTVTFLDELPRNPSGKVLKRTLREWGD